MDNLRLRNLEKFHCQEIKTKDGKVVEVIRPPAGGHLESCPLYRAPEQTEVYEVLVIRTIEQTQRVKVSVPANDPSPRMEARKQACAEAKALGKWENRSVSEPTTEAIQKIE